MRARAVRPDSAEKTLRDIRRATRRQYWPKRRSALSWKDRVAKPASPMLCRKEGIAQSMYYGWSKELLEAGKRRLAGDTAPDGGGTKHKTQYRAVSL